MATSDPAVFCHPGHSRAHRHASGRLKARIHREYGIPPGARHHAMDDLIPLSVGDANVAANLWSQSSDTQPWKAEVKDRLEWRVPRLICHGGLPPEAARELTRAAQRAFATNWTEAYQRWCKTEADCPSYAASHGGQD